MLDGGVYVGVVGENLGVVGVGGSWIAPPMPGPSRGVRGVRGIRDGMPGRPTRCRGGVDGGSDRCGYAAGEGKGKEVTMGEVDRGRGDGGGCILSSIKPVF